jgi:hypothetical protein
MANKNRPWTDAEDQQMRKMLAQGKSERSVAAVLRRTTGAVSSRLYILRTKAKHEPSPLAAPEKTDA